MGRKKEVILAIGIIIAGILASCASEPAPVGDAVGSVSVAEAKEAADSARTKADEVKADKAAPAEYKVAQDLYDKAVAAENTEDGDTARELYRQSAEAFAKAQALAEEARDAALAAMAEVDKAISETEQKAEEAFDSAEEDL